MMQKFYSYFNERGAKSSDFTPLTLALKFYKLLNNKFPTAEQYKRKQEKISQQSRKMVERNSKKHINT